MFGALPHAQLTNPILEVAERLQVFQFILGQFEIENVDIFLHSLKIARLWNGGRPQVNLKN